MATSLREVPAAFITETDALAIRDTASLRKIRRDWSRKCRVAPAQTAAAKAEPRPYFYEPSISPDRKEIAFISGGDIWTAPAEVMTLFAQRVIELHGSMAAWPAELGVSPATIDRLRERLLLDP